MKMNHLHELLKEPKIVCTSMKALQLPKNNDVQLHSLYNLAMSKGLLVMPGLTRTSNDQYEVVFGQYIVETYSQKSIESLPCILLSEEDVTNDVKDIWRAEHFLALASTVSPRDTKLMLQCAAMLSSATVDKKMFLRIFQETCGISARHARDFYNIVTFGSPSLIENPDNLRIHALAKQCLSQHHDS